MVESEGVERGRGESERGGERRICAKDRKTEGNRVGDGRGASRSGDTKLVESAGVESGRGEAECVGGWSVESEDIGRGRIEAGRGERCREKKQGRQRDRQGGGGVKQTEANGRDGAGRVVDLAAAVGSGYGDFWRCRARYRVLKGGKASKKSTTTALNFIVRLMQHPAANLLVIRAVMDTHRTSTYAQLEWAIRRLGVAHLWHCTQNPMEMTYRPTGQKILFRGFDNVYKLASTTVTRGVLCWVWVEEAFEIASEEAFDTFDLSAPRGEVPAGLFKQTTLTFNPWSDTHWLKRRFFDATPPDAAVFTTTYACNEWLDDADRAVFERLARDNPRRYAVVGRGEWGVAAGLIYEDWEVAPFDVDALPEAWRIRRVYGLDYGYTNDPTAFIAAAVDPAARRLWVFDEFCERGLLNCDIAARIHAMGYAGERIRADAAEPKSTEELRRAGISRIQSAAKGPGSLLFGIARLQEYHIVVHPKCRAVAAELSTYAWQQGDAGGVNRPRAGDDHLLDALRYAMEDITHFRPTPPGARAKKGIIRPEDVTGAWG